LTVAFPTVPFSTLRQLILGLCLQLVTARGLCSRGPG
jgi:hypothetical protein